MEPEFAYWTKEQAAFLNHLIQLSQKIEKLILEESGSFLCPY